MKRNAAIAIAFALALGLTACADDPEPDLAVDPTTVEPADTEFDTLDTSGDSYLDVDEVAEWAEGTEVFGDWDLDGNSELDRGEITGGAFELWDTDDNDIVSQAEWEDGVDLWYPDDADSVVFSDLDNDGDSELDVDEFSENVDLSPVGESWTADTLDEATFGDAYFELYDLDNDGRVSEDEWSSGVAVFE